MPKAFNPKDKYYQQAKRFGYPARSVFKLQEIQHKFTILKTGLNVLDLGAAPGSWLAYAAKIVGPKAVLVGVDLLAIKKTAANIIILQSDIFDNNLPGRLAAIAPKKFAVILSDLAPSTCGNKEVDHQRSLALSEQALAIGVKLLSARGTIVLKVFQGSDFNQFLQKIKQTIGQVKIFKPKSSRDRSSEVYLIIQAR